MSKVNKIQVGGDHYKSNYQHWDWVVATGLDYLAGCATKYITRWRKKNGLQDLQKAAHYLDKLIEVAPELIATQRTPFGTQTSVAETVGFVRANKLDQIETRICMVLSVWKTVDELKHARKQLELLIKEVTVQTQPVSPVPLEDSNKHAERE